MNKKTGGWTNKKKDRWMDKWMNEQLDRQVDGKADSPFSPTLKHLSGGLSPPSRIMVLASTSSW